MAACLLFCCRFGLLRLLLSPASLVAKPLGYGLPTQLFHENDTNNEKKEQERRTVKKAHKFVLRCSPALMATADQSIHAVNGTTSNKTRLAVEGMHKYPLQSAAAAATLLQSICGLARLRRATPHSLFLFLFSGCCCYVCTTSALLVCASLIFQKNFCVE